MSKGSIELLDRANDAFRRRDLEAFLALIDADAEVASRGPEGGSYRGHEGVRRSWQEIFGVLPDFGVEVCEVRDFGEVLLVAARGHGHGVGSDAPFEQKFWQVVELRGDKIARWRSFRSESDALEAVRAVHCAGPEEPTFRIAGPGDAHQIAAIVADAFEAYRVWAPSDWSPPRLGEEEELVLARALGRADVWGLLALAGGEMVGHWPYRPSPLLIRSRRPRGLSTFGSCSCGGSGRGAASQRISPQGHSTRRGDAATPEFGCGLRGCNPCPAVLRGAGLAADWPAALSLACRAASGRVRPTGRLHLAFPLEHLSGDGAGSGRPLPVDHDDAYASCQVYGEALQGW